MKKNKFLKISAVICLILSILTIIYLVLHPIDKALIQLLRRNYKITATIDVPVIDDTTFNIDIDNNIIHIHKSVYINEMYVEFGRREIFIYTKIQSGSWTKEKLALEEFDTDTDISKEIINHRNYENIDGTNVYRQKNDVEFEHVKNVEIIINDNEYYISGIIIFEDYEIGFKLKISEFGGIDVEPPEIE